jgi:holliday junction DNA helicase RuvA
MIGFLEGRIIKKEAGNLVVLVGGVGYRVLASDRTLELALMGSELGLWIYEQVREVSYELFGFTDTQEQELFEKLLGVNGVGPKMALSILNIGSANELTSAIARADAKYIQTANGVGKKVAEKVILELSGKLSETALDSPVPIGQRHNIAQADEAVDALVGLGYSERDAVSALSRLDTDLTTEEKIKAILKG